MAFKTVTYKVRGMKQDISESAFDSDYSFENMNIRIDNRNNNTLLSIEQEMGNRQIKDISIYSDLHYDDYLYSINELPFVVIGHCEIDKYLVLFGKSQEGDYILRLELDDDLWEGVYFFYEANLDFDIENPIETLGSVETEQMKKVYFVDGLSPLRKINIVSAEYINNTQLLTTGYITGNEKLKVRKVWDHNGFYPFGKVQFGFTYKTDLEFETNLIELSPLFDCVKKHSGGTNTTSEYANHTFELTFENLNTTSFKFLIIYIFHWTTLGEPVIKYKVVENLQNLPNNTLTTIVNYDDNDISDYTGNISDLVNKITSIIPYTIAEKDNFLFAGNIKNGIPKLKDYDFNDNDFTISFSHKEIGSEQFDNETIVTYDPYDTTYSDSNYEYMGFRYGNWYKFGFIVQYKTGEWSEVIYLKDLQCNISSKSLPVYNELNQPVGTRYFIPNCGLHFTQSGLDKIRMLFDDGFVKIKPVCVVPDPDKRTIITQGIVCPTMYNGSDRTETSQASIIDRFAFPSYFFRPKAKSMSLEHHDGFFKPKYSYTLRDVNDLKITTNYLKYWQHPVYGISTWFQIRPSFGEDGVVNMNNPYREYRHGFSLPPKDTINSEMECSSVSIHENYYKKNNDDVSDLFVSSEQDYSLSTVSNSYGYRRHFCGYGKTFFIDETVNTLNSPELDYGLSEQNTGIYTIINHLNDASVTICGFSQITDSKTNISIPETEYSYNEEIKHWRTGGHIQNPDLDKYDRGCCITSITLADSNFRFKVRNNILSTKNQKRVFSYHSGPFWFDRMLVIAPYRGTFQQQDNMQDVYNILGYNRAFYQQDLPTGTPDSQQNLYKWLDQPLRFNTSWCFEVAAKKNQQIETNGCVPIRRGNNQRIIAACDYKIKTNAKPWVSGISDYKKTIQLIFNATGFGLTQNYEKIYNYAHDQVVQENLPSNPVIDRDDSMYNMVLPFTNMVVMPSLYNYEAINTFMPGYQYVYYDVLNFVDSKNLSTDSTIQPYNFCIPDETPHITYREDLNGNLYEYYPYCLEPWILPKYIDNLQQNNFSPFEVNKYGCHYYGPFSTVFPHTFFDPYYAHTVYPFMHITSKIPFCGTTSEYIKDGFITQNSRPSYNVTNSMLYSSITNYVENSLESSDNKFEHVNYYDIDFEDNSKVRLTCDYFSEKGINAYYSYDNRNNGITVPYQTTSLVAEMKWFRGFSKIKDNASSSDSCMLGRPLSYDNFIGNTSFGGFLPQLHKKSGVFRDQIYECGNSDNMNNDTYYWKSGLTNNTIENEIGDSETLALDEAEDIFDEVKTYLTLDYNSAPHLFFYSDDMNKTLPDFSETSLPENELYEPHFYFKGYQSNRFSSSDKRYSLENKFDPNYRSSMQYQTIKNVTETIYPHNGSYIVSDDVSERLKYSQLPYWKYANSLLSSDTSTLITNNLQLNNSQYFYTNIDGTPRNDEDTWFLQIANVVNNNYVNQNPYNASVELYTWKECGYSKSLFSLLYDGKKTKFDICYEEGDTYFQRYNCVKTYLYDTEHKNDISDVASVMLESYINLDGIVYDNVYGIPSIEDEYLYLNPRQNSIENTINPVYSKQNTLLPHYETNYNYTSSSLEHYPTLVMWSQQRIFGNEEDYWLTFPSNNTFYASGNYGSVQKLVSFQDQVYCLQEHGFSQLDFNSKALIDTDNANPIYIKSIEGTRLTHNTYLSDNIGTQNKWSVISSKHGIYFVDDTLQSIYRFSSEGIEDLSQKYSFKTWTKKNTTTVDSIWNPWKFTHGETVNIVSSYDLSNNDVYFTNSNYCICFSESLDSFTSFYSYNKIPYMMSYKDAFFAIKNNAWTSSLYMNHANYSKLLFDRPFDSYVELLVNADLLYDKVFNFIEYYNDVYTFDNHLVPNDRSYNYIKVYNEYQDSGEIQTDMLSKQKFRLWRTQIPRNNFPNSRDRIRGSWCKIRLINKPRVDDVFRDQLHLISVNYTLPDQPLKQNFSEN